MNKQRRAEEGKLVAMSITFQGPTKSTILITREGKFTYFNNELVKAEPITSYKGEANQILSELKDRITSGMFDGKYSVQYVGRMPDVKLS
jgi:hypothetical protein